MIIKEVKEVGVRDQEFDDLLANLDDIMEEAVDKLSEDQLDLILNDQLADCMRSFTHTYDHDTYDTLVSITTSNLSNIRLKRNLVSTHWYTLVTDTLKPRGG
jgi:hypothetical protein